MCFVTCVPLDCTQHGHHPALCRMSAQKERGSPSGALQRRFGREAALGSGVRTAGQTGEPCARSPWGPGCTECLPPPDTALAPWKATRLITYRAQVQRFPSFWFFSFCRPSKPKAFCTPRASTFNCFTPINAINKGSPAPCCRVLPPTPCGQPSHHARAGQRLDSPRQARNPASPGSGVGHGSRAPPCCPDRGPHRLRDLASLAEYTATENNTLIPGNIPYN